MMISTKSRPSSKLGQVWSKIRSLGQIFLDKIKTFRKLDQVESKIGQILEKHLHSRGHAYST